MATGKDQEAPSLLSLRQQARTIYGRDAQGYDAGRPDYPAEVYEILAARCGLRAGASVVEIGPGTGLVTRRLAGGGGVFLLHVGGFLGRAGVFAGGVGAVVGGGVVGQ
jgi:hypothetical protein